MRGATKRAYEDREQRKLFSGCGTYAKMTMMPSKIHGSGIMRQDVPAYWTLTDWSDSPEGRIPVTVIKNSGWRILWVIASHVNYSIPRERLIKELIKEGIEDIHVTIAGAAAQTPEHMASYTVSYMPENMYEYTALLDIARSSIDYDYIYLLHDTIEIVNVKNCLLNQPAIEADFLPIRNSPQFNMGLLRVGWLKKLRPWLESLINIDKMTGIDLELERNGAKGLWSRADRVFPFIPGNYVEMPITDKWQTGHNRKCRFMPGAGIRKYFYTTHSNKEAISSP